MSVVVILQDRSIEAIKDGTSWKMSYEDPQFPRLSIQNEKGDVIAEFCRWVGVKKGVG